MKRFIVLLVSIGLIMGCGKSPTKPEQNPFLSILRYEVEHSVELESFNLLSDRGVTRLEWETKEERKVLGFNLYGSPTRAKGYTKINENLVIGQTPYVYPLRDNSNCYYKLAVVDINEKEMVCGFLAKDSDDPPASHIYNLSQNSPNPFNPQTEIRFAIPESTSVSLKIFDTVGKRVITLMDGDVGPGYYSMNWDGSNEEGQVVASGVYYYRLQAGEYSATRAMLLLK